MWGGGGGGDRGRQGRKEVLVKNEGDCEIGRERGRTQKGGV